MPRNEAEPVAFGRRQERTRRHHLAHVVVKLNQIDEDRPLDFEQEVLLVVLELGVQAVDDALAVGLGAELALEDRSQCVDPPAQVFAQFRLRHRAANRSLDDGSVVWLTRVRTTAVPVQPAVDLPAPDLRARPGPGRLRGQRACLHRRSLFHAAAFPRGAGTLIDLGHRRSLRASWAVPEYSRRTFRC